VPANRERHEARVEIRLVADQRRAIEQAAAVRGETVSHFIRQAATQQADAILRDASLIELSQKDRARFMAALDDEDARPGEALLRTVERGRALIG
jgi:uncharacterized protein (DUF1778 family)